MITIEQLKTTELLQPAARAWALDNLDYINGKAKLLGKSLKVQKGEKKGYYTAVMYLQPADKVSTKTLCAGAKLAGCKADCLISSGMLGLTAGQAAATRRTIIYLLDAERFHAMLVKEIEAEYRKFGNKLAIRLNGTSDIDFTNVIKALPHIRFYDYTKIWARVRDNTLPNYDLTYSGSAYSRKALAMTARAVNEGARVAIAFNTKELAGEYRRPSDIMDFDDTDLRFLEKPGLGGLTSKGTSKETRARHAQEESFFFTERTYRQLTDIIAIG